MAIRRKPGIDQGGESHGMGPDPFREGGVGPGGPMLQGMPGGPIVDGPPAPAPNGNPTGGTIPGMSSEGPRESEAIRRRPMEPTPMAGGVQPFKPLPSAAPGMMARAGGGLFGGQRGLTGGGLGVPLDPTSNAQSDPISSLMSLLKGMKFGGQ